MGASDNLLTDFLEVLFPEASQGFPQFSYVRNRIQQVTRPMPNESPTNVPCIDLEAWRILLIQIPLGNSFKSISNSVNWFAAAVGRVTSAIPWDSTDTDSLPSIKSQFSFVRH
jgi:hypothetical protein